MKKIVFDFEGKELKLEPSIYYATLMTDGNTKFHFKGEDYIVVDKIFYGFEQQAINDAKREELNKTPNYKGDYPVDAVELYVKLKKV